MTALIRSLSDRAAEKPQQVFGWFIALHLVVWTLMTSFSSPNAPLDVIEGYAWGREWLWGTYKHPPMQAWLLEIMARLTGRAPWAHFLLSQLAVVTAFWAVWETSRRIVGETQALISTILLEGIIYYNFTSPEFNPNVLQLTFWALATLAFYRAVKENKPLDWALLGLWSATSLYTKYSSFLLLSTFAALVIIRPEARRRLETPGPYLALVICVLLFLPHMVWLADHNFMPFTYVMDRLVAAGPATKFFTPPPFFPTFLLSPIVFVVAQILAILPFLMLFLTLDDTAGLPDDRKQLDKFDLPFVTAITFAPMIITLLMAIFFGFKVHDMWGAPFFNFVGLWALMRFYPKGVRLRPNFIISWSVVFAAGVFAVLVMNTLSPYIINKPTRTTFPGEEMAMKISNSWQQRFHKPLRYVIGDTWAAGNVGYYAPDRPHVFINADPTISPWINKSELKNAGGVVVWCQLHCMRNRDERLNNENKPDYLTEFPNAEIQPVIELARQTDADLPKVKFGWAIIPPYNERALPPQQVQSSLP